MKPPNEWQMARIRWACERKRRFPIRVKAEVHALQEMNRRQSIRQGKRLFVYHCPVCDGYHLTNNPPTPGSPKD